MNLFGECFLPTGCKMMSHATDQTYYRLTLKTTASTLIFIIRSCLIAHFAWLGCSIWFAFAFSFAFTTISSNFCDVWKSFAFRPSFSSQVCFLISSCFTWTTSCVQKENSIWRCCLHAGRCPGLLRLLSHCLLSGYHPIIIWISFKFFQIKFNKFVYLLFALPIHFVFFFIVFCVLSSRLVLFHRLQIKTSSTLQTLISLFWIIKPIDFLCCTIVWALN